MLEQRNILGTVTYMGGVMSLPEPFTYSWGNLCAFTEPALCQPGEHVFFDRTKYSLHDYARHNLLERMRGDWILMLDTDVAFDPDLAARLVSTMYRFDVDVLTGIYCYKAPPHHPTLYIWNPETERSECVHSWDRTSDLFQIDWAGAGCLLVKRKVFERITSELGENPFDRYGPKGEDHSFFIRLKKLGIPAYCAWKIELQHLEYLGITASEHFRPEGKPDHEFENVALAAPA